MYIEIRISSLYNLERDYVQLLYSVTWTMLVHVGMKVSQKNMKDKWQIAQNKIPVVRFILNLHHRKSVTYIEFEKLGFLNICNRVKQLRLNHVYNIFNNKSPEYMHTNFNINISLYGTRSSNSNCYMSPIKGGESTTFFYRGIKDWNSLPDPIKSCNNKNSFKFNVKFFLMGGLGSSFHSEFIFY